VAAHWYALRSKSGKEEQVWRYAQAQGHKAFYPHLRVRRVNPRARRFKPYFPGYLFVHADLTEVGVSLFDHMPNAIGLLCFGGEPAALEDELIERIRAKVEAIAHAGGEVFYGLKPGDTVHIQKGPLAGFDAIFDSRLSDRDRVRVFVQFLNDRAVAFELSAAQIQPKKAY
jgi:transcriptional antiterminator RfaH